jgi:NAD-dependent SIR2 family protein deacetylase
MSYPPVYIRDTKFAERIECHACGKRTYASAVLQYTSKVTNQPTDVSLCPDCASTLRELRGIINVQLA